MSSNKRNVHPRAPLLLQTYIFVSQSSEACWSAQLQHLLLCKCSHPTGSSEGKEEQIIDMHRRNTVWLSESLAKRSVSFLVMDRDRFSLPHAILDY